MAIASVDGGVAVQADFFCSLSQVRHMLTFD
jgi:hypothetical protein